MSVENGEYPPLEGVVQTSPSTLHMDGTSPVVVKVRATTDELRAIHGKRVMLVVIGDESDALGLARESQVRWEWPEIPEGWRYCDNQTFTNDGRMFRTATAAPKNESPYDHEHQHLEARRSEVERWVTPWSEGTG